jgi:hypothetical protein
MVTVTLIAGVAGIILSLAKRFMPFNVLAWILLSVGLGLTSTLNEESSRPSQYGFQVIMAIGGGIVSSPEIGSSPRATFSEVPHVSFRTY